MIGPTPALKDYLIDANPHDQFWDVLELTHPGWTRSYVLSNTWTRRIVIAEDGRYLETMPLGFQVDLPGAGTKGRQDMSVLIDNVDAEVWQALEIAQQQPQFPIRVVWRAYLDSDTTAPAANPITLYAYQVVATVSTVQLTASRSDIINNKWPGVVYRPERWPGLIR